MGRRWGGVITLRLGGRLRGVACRDAVLGRGRSIRVWSGMVRRGWINSGRGTSRGRKGVLRGPVSRWLTSAARTRKVGISMATQGTIPYDLLTQRVRLVRIAETRKATRASLLTSQKS